MALKTFTTADGSANQALVTNGSGVLSFAAVGASAGQVIQVITATDSTERSTTSTSFVTGSNTLSVTITASSASNKIFVIATVNTLSPEGTYAGYYTIFKGATNLGTATVGMGRVEDGTSRYFSLSAMSILDSPSTTAATTYQVYFAVQTGSGTATFMNVSGAKSSITCMEIKG